MSEGRLTGPLQSCEYMPCKHVITAMQALHDGPRQSTRERILAAAERLFAERGIDAVSVRAILAAAGVNVALAHRHFGSRAGLIDELLRRAIGPLNEERLRLLGAVEARGKAASLEDVLRAMFAPAVRWIFERPDRARLLAHVQASPDPKIRTLHREHFRDLVDRFGTAVWSRVPRRVTPSALVFRLFFVLGAGLVTNLHWADMARAAREVAGAVPDAEELVDEIVAFGAAGLRAAPGRRRAKARRAGSARKDQRRRRTRRVGSVARGRKS